MTKTTINAERDYVDERLCGVNDMTYEEWLSYQDQMLRYYNTYQYDSGPYDEEYYPSENKSSDENDESDDRIDIREGYCCCNSRGQNCSGKCHPDGYDRWLKARPSYLYRYFKKCDLIYRH